jgi:hypothetical protein
MVTSERLHVVVLRETDHLDDEGYTVKVDMETERIFRCGPEQLADVLEALEGIDDDNR